MSLSNLEKMAELLASEAQDVDDAALGVLSGMTLALAEGANLDVFGEILGRKRAGATDADYRDVLNSQIRLNLSGGTIEDILVVLALVFGSALTLTMTEGRVAEFDVEVAESITTATATSMAQALKRGKAGGVKANLKYHDTEPQFAYDGLGSAKFDGGYYYGSSIDAKDVI